MPSTTKDAPTVQVIKEISEQPQALNDLMVFYLQKGGGKYLQQAPLADPILFTGMGASFNAALAGMELCCQKSIRASAVEAADIVHWPSRLMDQYHSVIYISQSGESGEVPLVLEKVDGRRLVAITNDPESQLGKSAAVTLPLLAGCETLIASKTQLNSLALVWLLSRTLAGQIDGAELDQLKWARQRLQVMLEARETLCDRWQSLITDAETPIFCVGSGLQAVSAKQASLMLAEWAKLSAPAYSLHSFKHGFVEMMGEGTTLIFFESPNSSSSNDEEYLKWMKNKGARVIRVRDGYPLDSEDLMQSPAKIDPGLSILPEILSAQFLAIQLAMTKHHAGFRYLSKVVR